LTILFVELSHSSGYGFFLNLLVNGIPNTKPGKPSHTEQPPDIPPARESSNELDIVESQKATDSQQDTDSQQYMDSENVEQDEQWCYCKEGESEDDMIGCDHDMCPIKWFHLSWVCLTLDQIPKGKWYCPECRHQKRKK